MTYRMFVAAWIAALMIIAAIVMEISEPEPEIGTALRCEMVAGAIECWEVGG